MTPWQFFVHYFVPCSSCTVSRPASKDLATVSVTDVMQSGDEPAAADQSPVKRKRFEINKDGTVDLKLEFRGDVAVYGRRWLMLSLALLITAWVASTVLTAMALIAAGIGGGMFVVRRVLNRRAASRPADGSAEFNPEAPDPVVEDSAEPVKPARPRTRRKRTTAAA